MNIEWNATNYTNHFSFVHKYGEDVLKLIDAPAGSRVLDLGCGNGALTKKLQELGFQTQGMDASSEMLHVARQNYPDIRFEKGDATQFTLQDPVDVIFSNAVFHWIDAEKQDALAAHIASALKPGGTLVCEFGGKNCAESVHVVLEQCFTARGLHYPRINFFPTIAEYTAILERNGLRPDYAVLFDRPTPQSPGKTVVDWIEMFVGEPFRGMEETQKAEILQETETRLRPKLCNDGKWIIDYVRIRVRARKI